MEYFLIKVCTFAALLHAQQTTGSWIRNFSVRWETRNSTWLVLLLYRLHCGERPPEAQVLWDLPVEVTATAGQPYPHDKMGFLLNYEIAFGLRYAYKLEEVFFHMYRHVYRTLGTVVRSECWIWGDVL